MSEIDQLPQQSIAARAGVLVNQQEDSLFRRNARMFAILMGLEFIAGVVVALTISPRTWTGLNSQIHPHVFAAFLLGFPIVSLPIFLAIHSPTSVLTRHVIAIGQMLMCGLLIHLTGGRIETHFLIFGALAFLSFFGDWKILVTASLVTAADHLLRGAFWPQSIYGVVSAGYWRSLEHIGWVTFEDIFLVIACLRTRNGLHMQCRREAQLEATTHAAQKTAVELQQARESLEHRVAERTAELRRSEAEARKLAIVAAKTDNAVTIADAQGKIEWVNAAFARITECTLDDVKGKVICSILHGPETDGSTIQYMKERVEAGQGFNAELFNYTKTGRKIWVHLEVQVVRDGLGAIENFIVVRSDLTDRKKGEEELKRARDTAQSATRSKSEFLANMSHEIRTPISAIVGFADMMLDPGQTMSDRHDSLQTIRRNAKHLLGLINDILDISKIEAGQMTVERIESDVPSILAEVMSLMAPRAIEKKLELALVFDKPVPRQISTDPLRLKQILVNLLGNATKFTSSGRVELHVGITPTKDGQEVVFKVVDTGIGMTDEQLGRLFRPFAQADTSTTRKFGGTGLGLTISRRLAQLLGGDISASSIQGAGSTFTASIQAGIKQDSPLVSSIETANLQSGPLQVTIEKLNGRILLAEDGKDNQRFISAMLRKAGADVTIAENGRIAVELAQSESFDMIFMDMQMPEMDGYQAASVLRAKGFTIPIVALTAHAMSDDRLKCIQAGCTDYLTKPIDRTALIRMAAVHMEGKASADATSENNVLNVLPGAGAVTTHDPAAEELPPLLSTWRDDPALADILPEFVSNLPDRVADLLRLAAAGDLHGLTHAVHQI